MQVFLTGATGFVGSQLVPELIGAGHRVAGLCRSEAGAAALARAGAAVVRGDVNDRAGLRAAAAAADGIIHAAFDHDPANQGRSSGDDRRAIATLGAALVGSDRPFVVTSGTGLVRSKTGGPALETDEYVTAAAFPRAACEEAADTLIAAGGRVMVMRLPQVHDRHRQGRISWHVDVARRQGRVAYVGEGQNRLPAVHVSDAVRAYRLALETGEAGARYHAVAEEGVALRQIAEAIGGRLGMPVVSITPEEAPAYFGPLASLATLDLPASGALTRQRLGWTPTGPDLLSSLRSMNDGVS